MFSSVQFNAKFCFSAIEVNYVKMCIRDSYGIIPDDFYSFWVFFILNPISKILRFLKPLVAKHSTKCLINIVNKYPIYIITHPGSKINVDTEKLARACEEKGTALEINSSHSCLTEEGIIEALKTNVMFSIGSCLLYTSTQIELVRYLRGLRLPVKSTIYK